MNFRSKATGWESYSVAYEFASVDGGVDVRSVPHGDDWYMRAFLANASLRASCLSCPFKRRCGSDLTLGDYLNLPRFRLHPYAAIWWRSSSGQLARSNSSGLRYPSAECVLTLL